MTFPSTLRRTAVWRLKQERVLSAYRAKVVPKPRLSLSLRHSVIHLLLPIIFLKDTDYLTITFLLHIEDLSSAYRQKEGRQLAQLKTCKTKNVVHVITLDSLDVVHVLHKM